ncbi:MAG: arginine--tRNA ligase [Spirochaetaceae bacterium]|jgi:arginyl-tRNA synthetase|nr:arginine--tRNA ligase [Spirochaetaceae bacterium]
MSDIRTLWREAVALALTELKNNRSIDIADVSADAVVTENPPKPEMGDIGIPLFLFAKQLRMSPPVIAAEVVKILTGGTGAAAEKAALLGGSVQADGPYINIKLDKGTEVRTILEGIRQQGAEYGTRNAQGEQPLTGQRVMIEFSGPNTNKPLHLGHLRNDALGESVSRIMGFCGAEVLKVNIINNRGVHICKSMLAYQQFGEGKTPESEGIKSDRFVGDWYVQFHRWSEGEGKNAVPPLEAQAQQMLQEWERGNPEVMALWKQMSDWAVSGIKQTYERTGIAFDKYYYESETYLKGKDEVLRGLKEGVFYQEEDGSVWIDLAEIGLDKKVLMRKDGTTLYITQDIGTAIDRHKDWPFDRMVYVVASEQIYHFRVLFYILKKLGYPWAEQLYHLSYGMVNLPEGKMKSREGTVVDADDLINQLRDGALEEISAKGREEAVGDPQAVAEKVALGALHYYLLHITPTKDMLFNPKESLSFNGETGPYLQYMGARISSILRRAEETAVSAGAASAGDTSAKSIRYDLLSSETEWELVKLLAGYPAMVEKAARTYDPSLITGYLYDISKSFSRFYHDCPILNAENPELISARLELSRGVLVVLKSAMNLVLIPFLETM